MCPSHSEREYPPRDFLMKLNKWRNSFNGSGNEQDSKSRLKKISDPHIIENQIRLLVEYILVYKLFLESTLCCDEERNANFRFACFASHWFFDSVAMRVRRLVDKGHDVYSIVWLIKELKSNQNDLKRENIRILWDDEYNLEVAEQHTKKDVRKKNQAEINLDPEYHESRFDELCGVSSDERKPSDTPLPCLLENLLRNANQAAQSIRTTANKFIAHSTTDKSRQSLMPNEKRLTLDSIENAVKTLCEIAAFIKMRILHCGSYALFQGAWDERSTLGPPLIKPEDARRLDKLSEEYRRQMNEWYSGQLRPDWLHKNTE
jgi:hypothetical protein